MNIEEIAGKHLGKTADGKIMQRYESPMQHDSSLLVPIPREYNRTNSSLVEWGIGYEVWNAYEFSYLKPSGMPVTGVLRISYPSTTVNMIESKSLKLYLNSFDFERLEWDDCKQIIESDLSNVVDGEVKIHLHRYREDRDIFSIFFMNVDKLDFEITEFEENPDLLRTRVTHITPDWFTFHTANLRSNCEITNQKDTGNCFIAMKGEYVPDYQELTKYIFSLRNSQHFHENVTEIIYDLLYKTYAPDHLFVGNIYNRRGGIDIHSIRADSEYTHDCIMIDYNEVRYHFKGTLQS